MGHKITAFDEGSICSVCLATEDILTTDCCGRILVPQERWEISRGNFDYIEARGGWVELLLDSDEQAE
jgi:hypothetical protein